MKRKPPKYYGVRILLEEDAHEMFLASLEQPVPDKDQQVLEPCRPRKTKQSVAHKIEIDLHGLSLASAKELLKKRIAALVTFESTNVRVITGKGRHSPAGPVLAKEVYEFVQMEFTEWIERIDSSPYDALVGGLPVRGHFDVQLRKN